MKSKKIPGRFGQLEPAKFVSLAAFCLGMGAMGYGIAETAAHFLQVPVGATTPVTHDSARISSEPQAAARYEALAMSEPRQVAASLDRIESPRECAIGQGITDACTFN